MIPYLALRTSHEKTYAVPHLLASVLAFLILRRGRPSMQQKTTNREPLTITYTTQKMDFPGEWKLFFNIFSRLRFPKFWSSTNGIRYVPISQDDDYIHWILLVLKKAVGDGQGSLACCSPRGRRVGRHWATELTKGTVYWNYYNIKLQW